MTANKKHNIVIAGDLMLENIEDQYDLNTKKANVSIRAFPSSTTEDFKDYITTLALKKPDALIIHIGTNNVCNDAPPSNHRETNPTTQVRQICLTRDKSYVIKYKKEARLSERTFEQNGNRY